MAWILADMGYGRIRNASEVLGIPKGLKELEETEVKLKKSLDFEGDLYNEFFNLSEAGENPFTNPRFVELVIRRAARINPEEITMRYSAKKRMLYIEKSGQLLTNWRKTFTKAAKEVEKAVSQGISSEMSPEDIIRRGGNAAQIKNELDQAEATIKVITEGWRNIQEISGEGVEEYLGGWKSIPQKLLISTMEVSEIRKQAGREDKTQELPTASECLKEGRELRLLSWEESLDIREEYEEYIKQIEEELRRVTSNFGMSREEIRRANELNALLEY